MSLRDLIASPGHAIVGRLAKEYRIDKDVNAMLIQEIDRAVADEREACASVADAEIKGPATEIGKAMDFTARSIAAAIRNR